MFALFKKSKNYRWLFAGTLVAAIGLSGCKANNLGGNNSGEDDLLGQDNLRDTNRRSSVKDEWAILNGMKRPGAPATFFGFSDQAKEVEKNLGVD